MPVKLAPVVDTLDVIPESLRDAYEERDGKFHFAKEVEVEDLPSVANLKSAHNRNSSELKILKEKLKNYDGIDPDEHRTMKEEYEARKANGGKDPEREAIIAGIKVQHEKELNKALENGSILSKRVQRLVVDRAADEALAEIKPMSRKAAAMVMKERLQAGEDEKGEPIVIVLDPKGKPAYSKRTGEPMTPIELAEELSNDPEYKGLFAGDGASGAGARGSGRPAPGAGAKKRVTQEQMSNNDFYARVKDEATKAGKSVSDYVQYVDSVD